MDVTTGRFETFKDEQELKEAAKTGKWERVDRFPDPDCKECYGLGHLGRNILTNEYVPCPCVKFIEPGDAAGNSEEVNRKLAKEIKESMGRAGRRSVRAGAG